MKKHVKLNSSHVFSQGISQVFHSIFTGFHPIVIVGGFSYACFLVVVCFFEVLSFAFINITLLTPIFYRNFAKIHCVLESVLLRKITSRLIFGYFFFELPRDIGRPVFVYKSKPSELETKEMAFECSLFYVVASFLID